MKRPKTPSTPPTPQLLHRRPPERIPKIPLNVPQNPNHVLWSPLKIPKSELSLPLTFPTGQTFRWRQTGTDEYTGPVGPHLISLKQLDDDTVGYSCHSTDAETRAVEDLLDFLNMGISLRDLWDEFRTCDERFAELASHLEGARVLRQDPLECLLQFICSSNNNIKRISGMVDFLSGKGRFLGCVGGFKFHEFPTLERLASLSEQELREAGFGYRAKYIVGTVKALQKKPGGGIDWLRSLRKLQLEEAIDGLRSLPGVGPKVAACIALFSLDQHHAIPVDTHVWQIATRHLIPELAGTRMTPKMHDRVSDAFVSKYGKYAGWAQTLLFISQLPAQKAILPPALMDARKKAVAMRSLGDVQMKTQITQQPTKKTRAS